MAEALDRDLVPLPTLFCWEEPLHPSVTEGQLSCRDRVGHVSAWYYGTACGHGWAARMQGSRGDGVQPLLFGHILTTESSALCLHL